MGTETQTEQKKWRPLEKMFNEVPVRYDMLNRVITWRLDESWRKAAVRKCLEVATLGYRLWIAQKMFDFLFNIILCNPYNGVVWIDAGCKI